MIALILFSIICFVIIWFIVFKVILIYQKRNLFKNIPEKLEKQDKRFFNDGKEVNFKELLGREEKKQEVVEEIKEEPEETIEDVHPEPEEEIINSPKEKEASGVSLAGEVDNKKPKTTAPLFPADEPFKLPGKEE